MLHANREVRDVGFRRNFGIRDFGGNICENPGVSGVLSTRAESDKYPVEVQNDIGSAHHWGPVSYATVGPCFVRNCGVLFRAHFGNPQLRTVRGAAAAS